MISKGDILVSFIVLFTGAAVFTAYNSDWLTFKTVNSSDEDIPSLNPKVLLNTAFVAESHSESGYQILYLDLMGLRRHWMKIDVKGNIVTGSVKTKGPVEENMQTSLVYDLVNQENKSYFCMQRKEPLSKNFISNSFVDTVSSETGTMDFGVFGDIQQRRELEERDPKDVNGTNILEYAGKIDLLLSSEFFDPENNATYETTALVHKFLFHYEKKGHWYTIEYYDRVSNRIPVLFIDAQDVEWWVKPAEDSDVNEILSEFPPTWCKTFESVSVEFEPLKDTPPSEKSACTGWVSTTSALFVV